MTEFDELFPKQEYISVNYTGRRPGVRKKDKHYFSKFWVSVLILTVIAYVVTVFYYSWHEKHVPDSLTYTFVPAIIAQLANMMLITRKEKDVEIAHIQQDGQKNQQNIL